MGVLKHICVSLLACIAFSAAFASDAADYGDTYTPEELAAIERILWAGNMTFEDLHYKKDYTEGKACFPIVREMMDDPLLIAAWMDRTAQFVLNRIDLTQWRELSIYNLNNVTAHTGLSAKGGFGVGSWFGKPASLDEFVAGITEQLEQRPWSPWTDQEHAAIRQQITEAMAWHAFEEPPSMDSEDSMGMAELYEVLSKYMVVVQSQEPWVALTRKLAAGEIDPAVFPVDAPVIHDTPNGRVCIGTLGDDYYEGDFAVLIEPGGNDTYHNCRIGAAYGKATPELGDGRVGYFADLGGDDFYDCADVDITLGAAVLGVAAFYDLGGGDDRYYAGSCSLGAAMGGIATFYDDGGSDYYSGKVYTQGAAGFGIGIMVDDSVADAPVFDTAEGNDKLIDAHETGESETNTHGLMDNDTYTAWSEAQAFARTRGVALCINRRGNEVYHAGGVYLHAPLFADRYQSFSQGFAIGERDIDYAGGIAMLIDYDGNDRYLGDIYNQGVGYWYSAGLLWDGSGNDTYEMTQYGQGSGIHLAVGGLVDVSGSDTYIMHSGLGQGSSHDLAVSVLHDRGGDDRYNGNTSCNGSALAGATGLFIDRSGNDTYTGKPGSINTGDTRRTNLGLFVDLAGEDVYMNKPMADSSQWRQANIGLGIDVAPPPVGAAHGPPEGEPTSGPNMLSTEESNIPIPEICSYEGELTQEVFDELWEIAVRWEVGDNRVIVPKGRERLIAFGPAVLPYVAEVMDNSNSGLALRAFQDVYTALWEVDAAAVGAVLRDNATSDDKIRRQNALYLIGEMKKLELEDVVVAMLDDADPGLQRRAIAALGNIGSHAADDRLIAMVQDPETPEEYLLAAITTLTDLEVDCFQQIGSQLGHPLFTVREQLVRQFVKHWDVYGDNICKEVTRLGTLYTPPEELQGSYAKYNPAWFGFYTDQPVGYRQDRALRSMLQVLQGLETAPMYFVEEGGELRTNVAMSVAELLNSPDWGVRADVARLTRHWQELAADDEMLIELINPAVVTLDEVLKTETDPFVLSAAGSG